jgi:FkbM family methyltransferase
MKFISYSQNFEDVMLWRTLQDVKDGFYIDVGANYPEDGSVTKLFYENGWSGINIEPENKLYNLLKEDRPRDLNLNVAISTSVEPIEFYVSKDLGWSTTDKTNVAELKETNMLSEIRKVNTMTLDEICNKYDIKLIHFLKVDVEGAEYDVLKSISFEIVRPWIVVVEATKPRTAIDVSVEWETLLIEQNYIFAYFDGLNKFYVAKEKSILLDRLKTPPNIFDNFILNTQLKAEKKSQEMELMVKELEKVVNEGNIMISKVNNRVNELKLVVNKLTSKLEKVMYEYNELKHHYDIILNSKSWKITKPLREIVKILKKFKKGIVNG